MKQHPSLPCLVSPEGEVFSLNGRKRKQYDNGGYKGVTIQYKLCSVHVLVAETYIPNPSELPEVNHIDFDKTNNNVTNLEWMTHGDNCRHNRNKPSPTPLTKEQKYQRWMDKGFWGF